MLIFLFIFLAGYAVKCDDASNNYYVIEMPEEDVPSKEIKKQFKVYWNVPTMQCRSKKIPFTNLYEKYGIIQNTNDDFRGEAIAILYDPGLFPALLKNETSGKFKFRNGGVPQEGVIDSHLDAFRLTMEQSIPDADFKGVGIIDFESWRPIFRQNFGVLVPYKDVSYEIEKKLHWWWPKTWVQEEASKRFEEAAKIFMERTLSLAKQMRPLAQWGYYGFPYCFNMAANNSNEKCSAQVLQENNQIKWLWSESAALYPSIYSSETLTSKQLASLIRGRVAEASRSRMKGSPILPYYWFRYRDGGFMSKLDLDTVLKTLYRSNASGFIIWGSSNDVNTKDKCNKLQSYVDDTLGPAIAKYAKQNNRGDDEMTTKDLDYTGETVTEDTANNNPYEDPNENVLNGNNTTYQPLLENTESNYENKSLKIETYNAEIQLDPEFHWVPPETYNQDIIQNVEDELKKKSIHNSSSDEHKQTYNFKDNLVINMLMNALSNSETPIDYESSENNSANNLDYITKQINNLVLTSYYPPFQLTKTNPSLEEKIEITEGTTLSAIVLNSYDGIKDATEEPKPIKYNNTNNNSFTAENMNVLSTNENEDGQLREFTDEMSTITSASPVNLEMTDIDDTTDVLLTQSIYTETDEFEIVTEDLNTSTGGLSLLTENFDLDTNMANNVTETIKDSNKDNTMISNYEANSHEVHLDTSTQSYTTVTEESYVDVLSNYTLQLLNFTDTNEEEFIYINEEETSVNYSSLQTENLATSTESNVFFTNESNSDLSDNVTESSMLDEMRTTVTEKADEEETTEDNFTSVGFSPTSSPDKVVVYIL